MCETTWLTSQTFMSDETGSKFQLQVQLEVYEDCQVGVKGHSNVDAGPRLQIPMPNHKFQSYQIYVYIYKCINI